MGDLEEAAERFLREYGLESLPGGRHPGRGTANRIIPLGSDYLELITVADAGEAAALPASRRVAQAIAAGRTYSAWAVRTDDLDAMRAHLARRGFRLPELTPGARTRPDGVRLEWRMQETVQDAAPSPLPFLIEWKLPAGQYPGEMQAAHPSGAAGMAAVVLADPDPPAAEALLGEVLGDGLEYRVERGDFAGLVAVEVATPSGRMVIR